MKAKGCNWLRLTGFLELAYGIGAIASTLWILSQKPGDLTFFQVADAANTLWVLVVIYAIAGFQILSGLIGMILSNSVKHAKICYVLGLILILIQAASFGNIEYNITTILTNTVALIVPCFYFYGAALNKKQVKEVVTEKKESN